MTDIIAFKGVSNGVYLEIKDSNIDNIIDAIDKTMKESGDFFRGGNFLGVKGKELEIKDVLDISYMLKYKYDFNISIKDILESIEYDLNKTDLEETEEDIDIEEDKLIEIEEKEIIDEGMTKFVYGTLRSGQMVEYDGNIVIVGDVNPGALLKAVGNIIVLGTLRGVAYAGREGNNKSIVAAYNLLPQQLGIANLIVRAPDEGETQYKLPEVAKISKGKVVIEPYLPNK